MYVSYKYGKNLGTALVERVLLKPGLNNNWEITIWVVGSKKPIKTLICDNYEEAILKYEVFSADLRTIDIGELKETIDYEKIRRKY